MGLLQKLKTNSSTFHIRTKEEIDQLFRELTEQKLPMDNKMDFYIRMSIQVLKLQLYYDMKLVEYRRTVNSSKRIRPCVVRKDNEAGIDTKNKTLEKKESSLQQEDIILRNKTKEEIIAENKARLAKYHPEPDLETYPTAIYRARKKIEYEKEMKKWNKGRWVSIISIPMK